jgi:hypothetical protein
MWSCKNKEVNHEDGPNFNEIHENLRAHFDEVNIGGNDYYILERDRNNPHEGFGFMALKGNKIFQNQDSIKAYLKTLIDIQVQLLARRTNQPLKEVEKNTNELFLYHLENNASTDNNDIKKADD